MRWIDRLLGDAALGATAAVLMSTAALGTSWASYQATTWNDQQRIKTLEAGRLRQRAGSAQIRAQQMRGVDVVLFTSWLDAEMGGRRRLADIYAARFRPEFRPAFGAWMAQDPFGNPEAPPSPFAMPEYRLELDDEVAITTSRAEVAAVAADVASGWQSAYVMNTVIFALALFFAGTMQGGTRHRVVRGILLLAAVLACLGGLLNVLRLPMAPH